MPPLIRQRAGPFARSSAPSALALLAAGCNQEAKTEPPLPRPVRTVTVEKGAIGDSVQLTGDIRAENEVNLAFRIGGRIIERKGEVGDKVEPDQVLAKLDPQDELNSAALGAGGAQRRARPGGRGAEQFRPPEPPDGARLHHAGDFRFREAGAADGAGPRRRRDARNSISPRIGLSFTELKSQCRGDDHRPFRRVGSGGAGGPADLHRRAAGRARRGVRRPRPGS